MSSYIYLLYPLVLAVLSGITGLVVSFMAASYWGKHTGTKIDYWDVRFHGLKYLKRYRELTIKENGKPGGLYAAGVVAFTLFVVSMITLVATFIVLSIVG